MLFTGKKIGNPLPMAILILLLSYGSTGFAGDILKCGVSVLTQAPDVPLRSSLTGQEEDQHAYEGNNMS